MLFPVFLFYPEILNMETFATIDSKAVSISFHITTGR